MKRIAIVVLDWNGLEVTEACLQSLAGLQPSPAFTHKVVLVDNGSVFPLEPQLANQFPDVHFIRSEKNLGFAAGNNLGIGYALEQKFEYTLLLNNDTTVEQDFLIRLYEVLENDKQCAAAQPKILFQHNPTLIWNAGTFFRPYFGTTGTRGYGKQDRGQYDQPVQMPWLTGCCILINNTVFTDHHVERLNARYETYYEDAEFSFRLRKAGFRLAYVPSAVIRHIAGYSVNQNQDDREGPKHPHIVYLHTRNRIWFMQQCTPWYYKPLAYPYHLGYVVLLLGYYALRGRWNKFSMVMKAFRDSFILAA